MRSTPTKYPKVFKVGSVGVKVYRLKHAQTASGWVYQVTWATADGRRSQQFADEGKACEEARLKAAQLAAGRVEGGTMTSGDRDELQAARRIASQFPVLTALAEWSRARELTGGHVLPAAEAWAARNVASFKRIKVSDAVEAFIKAKERAGKQGERTYRAKLGPLPRFFGPDTYLDTISAPRLTAYLEQWQDGVTRNDLRKRAGALWRWAQRVGHLPRGIELEIAHTERANENRTDIGILNADTFARVLEFFRGQHPETLAALVLAGFCGIRADEIHGKRQDRSVRQTWEDIHLAEKFVRVTTAKKNTPAWRHVPLCDAAVEWLMLCPDRAGPVCAPAALEKARKLASIAGFKLPENCLRHSFISYRVAVTADKARVATEAGNSVGEIDRRYRVPVTPGEGAGWFTVKPRMLGEVINLARVKN